MSLSICPLLFLLLICYSSFAEAYKFYIYDWPDIVNQYSKVKNDLDPHFVLNHGAGPVVDERKGFYATWQFALFKIMYERLAIDPRRTYDPEEATTFIMPYDYGLDACFRQDNGKMRKINCPLAAAVTNKLYASKYFNQSFGKNHLLIVSVNQNMNYFLGASNCQSFLSRVCYNCTKLAIDEYSWLHSINRVEAALNKRGDYWHAIPFPANIHYHVNMCSPYPWDRAFAKKEVIASYTGSLSSYNAVSYRLRKSIGMNCQHYVNHTREDKLIICETTKYVTAQGHHTHKKAAGPQASEEQLPLACRSIFCFQPPGDMSTRKSVFDSILCGCIPVFYSNLTGPLMYEWNWDMKTWFDASIMVDVNASKQIYSNFVEPPKDGSMINPPSLDPKTDLIKMLSDLYDNNRELVEYKRKVIEDNAIRLQYSIEASTSKCTKGDSTGVLTGLFSKATRKQQSNLPLTQIVDAYEVAIRNVLDLHTGKRSHARVSHYMRCEDKFSYNVDWCHSTGSLEDVRVT